MRADQLGRGEQRAEEGARVVREAPQEHEQLLLALEGHERAGEVGALRGEGVTQQPAEAAG